MESAIHKIEENFSPKFIIQDENIIIEQPFLNDTVMVTGESLTILKDNNENDDDDDDNEDIERHNRTIRFDKRQTGRRTRVHNRRRPKMNKAAAAAHYMLNMQNLGNRKRRETGRFKIQINRKIII